MDFIRIVPVFPEVWTVLGPPWAIISIICFAAYGVVAFGIDIVRAITRLH